MPAANPERIARITLLADQAGDAFTVTGDHTWRSFGPLFGRAGN